MPSIVSRPLKIETDVERTGPVVDNIKSEASRTGQEFRDLSNAKVAPDTTTATGQPLTYYHSLLYSLLSVSVLSNTLTLTAS